jgi:hypothetical protein
VNEMKKVLMLALGGLLLAPHVFSQSPASSETNRITGARLDVKYNEDKTNAMVHVKNISKKTIATVRIALIQANGSSSRSSSGPWNLEPGGGRWETVSSVGGLIDIDLDAIIYTDGTVETRNDTVAAEMKVEEARLKEQHDNEMRYARAFAASYPASYMQQEEQIVRNYYAKLGFLSQLQILSYVSLHGVPTLTETEVRRMLKDQIRFDLSEFQIGDFAEIETRPWPLLLNPDAPQSVIDVNRAGANIGVNHHDFSINWYQVAWSKPQIEPEQQQEQRDQMAKAMLSAGVSAVKDAAKLMNPGNWTRYASFTVRARLRGRAITYRATFLFARNGEAVAAFDPAMRVPVELNGPFYPTVLVDSVYRELPFFKSWVAEHQLSGCKKLKEPEICCDPATGQCGLAAEDVAHSLTLPIDDNDRWVLKGLMATVPALKQQTEAACPVEPVSGGKK